MTDQQIRAEVLKLLKNNGKKAFRPKEIAKKLGYRDNRVYRRFLDVLGSMEGYGAIERVKGGRYTYKGKASKLTGTLQVNPQGFGFVTVEGRPEDVFIRRSNLRTALDGDEVLVGLAAPRRGERRREAEVIRVVQRNRTQAVGTLRHVGHFSLVQPDDKRLTHDVYVPNEARGDAQDGDKVVVSIDSFDDPRGSPEGRVLEVLGSSTDPATQVLALARSFGVQSGFPEAVEAEAESIPDTIAQAEIDGRLDLRDRLVFTIDPDDAKDFDDAIHIEPRPGGFELGVHIADVSHYVRPGTPLDREAFQRATSVYLVDRVIPMLPEKLSNQVCSLRPREDKLTYSCIMEVTPEGDVTGYRIRESVIHSAHRLTYEEAQELIDYPEQEHPLSESMALAAGLAARLTERRLRTGSVDFDLPEVRVVLDEAGHPKSIVPKARKPSNRLIEEFMLLANRTVAGHVGKADGAQPFVYRVHDFPDDEKISRLAQYVRAFGHRLDVKDGKVDSRKLNALLDAVKGTPEEMVIEQAALRAMAKAKYSTDNIGHYGLGFSHYTHFTSPIRRYPDLMVHRLLKRYAGDSGEASSEGLEARCLHCSERERAATEAERESIKLKQVEYIRDHLGEAFKGVVSGVTNFGVFVELNQILIEGMVHVRDLDDDYYEYDERTYSLVGRHTGRTFRLGDPVEVVVAGANLESREIDFLFSP